MRGQCWRTAIAVATIVISTPLARAEESDVAAPRTDSTMFDTSTRLRMTWTEIAFAGNHPKAWDDILSPEFRLSVRVLDGLFEGKLEVDA